MRQSFSRTVIAALSSLLLIGGAALAQEDVPRLELGAQFSLFARHNPTPIVIFSEDKIVDRAKPGFGGRVTLNLTNNLALEAEFNTFSRQTFESEVNRFFGPDRDYGVPGGRIIQGQFGVKAGKRFKRFGIFGKARPGFVRFDEVNQLISVREVVRIIGIAQEIKYQEPVFQMGSETYYSADVGGVLEFYPSRRIVTRFDLGDTIIRYGVFREPVALVCVLSAICLPEVDSRPSEIRHSLQFSAGIGFRF